MDSRSETIVPRVSVLMLAYNRADSIVAAIESVRAQSFTDWECIIIDDGSTDGTADAVRAIDDSRIRFIHHEENAGVIARRNEAASEARGQYIAILDSDDRWIDTDKLAKQVTFLDTHPDYAVVGTQAKLLGGNFPRTLLPMSDNAIRRRILSKNRFIHSSCVLRKRMIPTELYRSQDRYVEDYSLWLRLGMHAKFANLPDVAVAYFVNPTGHNRTNVCAASHASLKLIHAFKDTYPNYWYAVLMWRAKLFARCTF